jgi:hypothetical protein
MTHLRMIVVSAVLVIGAAVAPAASAVNPPRSNNTHCQDEAYAAKHPLACKPKASSAPGATAALNATDLAKTVAEMAGKEVGKELGGFFFNQIGLGDLTNPNSGDFEALKSQLEKISGQITTLQTSVEEIDRELAEIHLTQFTEPLQGDRSSVESLWRDDFHPLLEDLQTYVEEKLKDQACKPPPNPQTTPPTPALCFKAKKALDDDLAKFTRNALTTENQRLNIDIHNNLMPANGDSVMIAYGRVLMKGSGFLTSADSDKLLAFYRFWSGWEALAVWMKAEAAGIALADPDRADGPAKFSELVRDQMSGAPCPALPPQTGTCGFFDLEQKQLPPAIPNDVVIALPANSTARTTTLGQPMWLWNARVGGNAVWDPTRPETATHSVPAALTTLNTTSAGIGFADWRVPSAQDLNGLFAGRLAYSNLDGLHFLDKVLPESLTSFHPILITGLQDHPFLWTSTAPAPVPCNVSVGGGGFTSVGNITNYAHTGLQVNARLADFPGKFAFGTVPRGVGSTSLTVPGNITTVAGALQWCRDTMAARVTAGFAAGSAAQLLVTRQTTVNYMPVP